MRLQRAGKAIATTHCADLAGLSEQRTWPPRFRNRALGQMKTRVRQAARPLNAAPVVRGSIPRAVETGEAHVTKALEPGLPIRLTIVLLPPKRLELRNLIEQILDPHSPRFHQFLTFAQWKASYAPTNDDVQAIAEWASTAGLHEVHRFATNQALVVEGTVSSVQQAFHVQLNEYELGSRHFFGNDRRPTVPTEIAGKIQDILGLNSFARIRSVGAKLPFPEVKSPRFLTAPLSRSPRLTPMRVISRRRRGTFIHAFRIRSVRI